MMRELMEPMRWQRVRGWFGPFIVCGGFEAKGPHQVLLGPPPGATIN